MELEACGIFPVGSYWTRDEWYYHLYSNPRWGFAGLVNTEKMKLIGSMVYQDAISGLFIHKITVSEQGHLNVLREMLSYMIQTVLGSRNRVVAYPNARDVYWLKEFEHQGFLNTGSFPHEGEILNAVEWNK